MKRSVGPRRSPFDRTTNPAARRSLRCRSACVLGRRGGGSLSSDACRATTANPTSSAASLCQRLIPARLIALHHLTPRQKGGKAHHHTPLCKPCHKQIDATFGNTDLARVYASIEALRKATLLQPFLKWIRKQSPHRNFRTARSREHPHNGKRRY